MKKLFFRISLLGCVAAVLLTTGCEKAVEVDESNYLTIDQALQTQDDYEALINSTYTVLAADAYWGGRWQAINELTTDHIFGNELSGDYQSIYNRNVSIFNTAVSGYYGQPWTAVLRANMLLENMSVISDATMKSSLEGQAKFIRAMAHFDLVRIFAQPYQLNSTNTQLGIPIKTLSKPTVVTRATVAEDYAQILKDLKEAETLLPDANGVYPTKWAAKALLARIYFQMNDFTNAYSYANQVIASNKFVLDADYKSRFSPNGTREAIFELIYEPNNPSGRFGEIRTNYRTNNGSNIPLLKLSSSFYNKATATATDARKIWYTTRSGYYLLTKFDSLSFKMPVLHLTEMKLIRAESAAELNSNLSVAIQDINDIMKRAYGASSPLLLASSASAQSIKDAVRRERELELIGEGDWLQELKRRGAKGENVTIRNAPWNCNGLVFVFPTNEVNLNPGFQQNPTGGCN